MNAMRLQGSSSNDLRFLPKSADDVCRDKSSCASRARGERNVPELLAVLDTGRTGIACPFLDDTRSFRPMAKIPMT